METICSYEWDDVDAGVLCRHLGMGMSGRATYLPRDWSFVRADAYGVYCHGNETDPHDCHVNKNDTTYGMCGTMDDAGVECEGKVLLLFQKSLLLSSSDIIFDYKIGVIDMRNEWNKVLFL